MPNELMTAGNMAKQLGVPDARVRKALTELKIAPAARKGGCSYYGADAVELIRKALK